MNQFELVKLPFIIRITIKKHLKMSNIKHSIIRAFLCCLVLFALGFISKAQITLTAENKSVREILKEIEKSSDYRFFYNDDLTSLNKRISVKAKDVTIQKIMQQIVEQAAISYVVKPNNQIVLSALELQQKRKTNVNLEGLVVDDNGEPIIGVNIVERGTTNGTVSDIDGKFVLNVSSDAVLQITYIGYVSQEISVKGKQNLVVTLKDDSQALDEVIVVGYGTQKKINVTGAVSSINFEDQASSRPITSVSASLAGLSAGLSVSQSSGQPGSNGATLRIRGIGTMNDNNPLILIDGMQGSLDDLNPNDIASVSILKDGASAAIYGSRAGSGVILITTKNGNSQGKVNVTYSGRLSVMNPANLPKVVNNYADYMEYANEAYFQSYNEKRDLQFAQSTIDLWREKALDPNGLNEYGYPNYVAFPNTDWQKEIYNKNSLMHEHNLSVTGNSNNTRYLLSIGYMDNPGIVDNSGLNRYTLRINLESDITKWLTIGTRTYGNKDVLGRLDFDGTGTNAISRWIMSTTPGMYPMYDGIYGAIESVEESPNANNIRKRIDGYSAGNKDRIRLNTTVYGKVKFMEGLTWDINLNYERLWEETNSWGLSNLGRQFSFSRNTNFSSVTSNDKLSTSNSRHDRYSYTLEHLLNFSRTFASDHDVTAMVGYQEYYYKNWSNGASRRGLIDETIHTVSSGTEISDATGSMNDRASRAVFGRLTYAYKSRYLFEFNTRYDGHSRFHKEHRWGLFPSASVGWRLSEEAFMEKTKTWLDNLKLRLSWGKNGNYGGSGDDIDYEYQGGYITSSYSLSDSQRAVLIQKLIANPALKWETTQTTNVGIDANFLNQRLSFEFDAYWKKTDGILYRVSIPLTAGDKTAPRLNLAELKNNGYEVTVGWKDQIGKFNYGVSGNFGFTKNALSKYKGKLQQGWVTDENGNRVWKTNLGDVSEGSHERILEDHMYQEYFLRSKYQGTGTYFDSEGKVDPAGGPKDGMIRTEKDMEWAKAMGEAGYVFQDYAGNIGNRAGLYYGDYIYADLNEDGILGNDADRSFFNASRHPKYTFGFQLFGEWKGFDVSMNFAGAAGFKLLWTPERGYNSTMLEYGTAISERIAKDHYFYNPENPMDSRTNLDAKYPRLSQNNTSSTRFASDIYLHKGDYLKLKNLTVGYTLPTLISQKIYAEKIRLYFSGENLFSIDSYPGVDPEQGASPKYQPIKQFAFGVNVTF